jgi:hypothetical protein
MVAKEILMKNATSGLGRAVASSSDNGNAGIPKNCNLSEAARPRQTPTQLLAIFRERCEARALLVAEGVLDLIDAVDQLQQAAVDQELIDHFGTDEIQQVMSDAFKRGGRRWIL